MSSALGDKKGRVADSSDLTRLQRESAVLAAYTTYTGLSVNKKANQQLGNDRKFTLGRGGLTLKADATTGITRNPINGKVVVAPYTPPVYGTVYAIPDFSTATVVSDGNPYIVSSGEQQYSVEVSSILNNNPANHGGQYALLRTTQGNTAWTTPIAYDAAGLPTSGLGETITITAPSPFLILAYSLGTGILGAYSPTSWILSGSTDGGATFTTIDTQTGQDLTNITAIYTYSLPSNTTAYTVYKLLVTAIPPEGEGYLSVRQFNLLKDVVVSE